MSARDAIVAGAFAAWVAAELLKRNAGPLPVAEVARLVDLLNDREFAAFFDRRDVLAIVEIESGFDPDAWRWEWSLMEPSLGLMQVLMSTARDRGFDATATLLFDPVNGLRVGMAHLKWSYDFLRSRLGRAPTAEEWIGSYNVGVGNVLKGNIPAGYVGKWKSARARY